MRESIKVGTFLLLASAACTATAAEARSVVLRATGPSSASYRPGQILPEPIKLQLKSGDLLILLDANGTRELKGPASVEDAAGAAASRPPNLDWKALVGSRPRPRAGGVRGGDWLKGSGAAPAIGLQLGRDSLWQIDATEGGDWCAVDLGSVQLWREDSSRETELNVTAENGPSSAVRWPVGSKSLSWPASLADIGLGRYRVSWLGGGVELRLHKVEIGATVEVLARELARNGCDNQLELLVYS